MNKSELIDALAARYDLSVSERNHMFRMHSDGYLTGSSRINCPIALSVTI